MTKIRTRSTTTRDRNLQFRGAVSTGFLNFIHQWMFFTFSPGLLCNLVIRGRHGGVEKRGGWKTSRMTPLPKRGFGPPSYGAFSNPLRCQCSVFPVQKCTTEQTRSSFGGVQKFSGERVLWYVFLPPYVLHTSISRPKVRKPPQNMLHGENCPTPGGEKQRRILSRDSRLWLSWFFGPGVRKRDSPNQWSESSEVT